MPQSPTKGLASAKSMKHETVLGRTYTASANLVLTLAEMADNYAHTVQDHVADSAEEISKECQTPTSAIYRTHTAGKDAFIFPNSPTKLGHDESDALERLALQMLEPTVEEAAVYRTATLQRIHSIEEKDVPGTLDYRVFVKNKEDGEHKSAWHDIPLHNDDGTLNFVCEIPKMTAAKFEVATKEEKTPIKQDEKKGKPRFYPYPIEWNYGMLPQTWEDPAHTDDSLGVSGDNDPVDVVEIGSAQLRTGGIYKVKPLGAYAMIDDGELDWKIICIKADDPLADKISDIEDVERELPGELEKIMVWFRDYKIPDGKPPNNFGFDAQCMAREFATKVVQETNEFYMNLRNGLRVNDDGLHVPEQA